MAKTIKPDRKVTSLGEYLSKRSINRAGIARKTGIHTTRLNRLVNDPTSNLRAEELYLIALAIGVDPAAMQKDLLGHLTLQSVND